MRPQPSQAAFIEAALTQLGVTKTELGALLDKPDRYATVQKWITGHTKLSFEDTVAIAGMCGWLKLPGPGEQLSPEVFSRTLLGQLMALLEQEPALLRRHADLLRAAAAELRVLASRMEAAAERPNDATPP